MTEDQIKHMVDRFLGWRLPLPWNPDNGIIYQRPNYLHAPADHDWPTGTNLFDANQTTEMVRHMLQGLTSLHVEEVRPEREFRVTMTLSEHEARQVVDFLGVRHEVPAALIEVYCRLKPMVRVG